MKKSAMAMGLGTELMLRTEWIAVEPSGLRRAELGGTEWIAVEWKTMRAGWYELVVLAFSR